MVNKIVKEPLLIFLMLGGLIFAIFQPDAQQNLAGNPEILVTEGRIQALTLAFEKAWQRPPSAMELDGLIQGYVREEVLYREALALGLDRDDGMVRRRMRQKMEFLSEDLASLEQPSEQELQAFFTANQEQYRISPRFSFVQIYLNASKRGPTVDEEAGALLKQLIGQDKDIDLTSLGDPLLAKQEFNRATEREIERVMGGQFLRSLRDLPVGDWQGPLTSGFGLHLVRIDEVIDGRVPELGKVREEVLRDWSVMRRRENNEAFYQRLRAGYKVTIATDTENRPLSKPSESSQSPTGSIVGAGK